jgi:diacylglycerol kinase (ATP)
MRVLLLHNPEAGGGANGRAELMRLLQAHGHEPRYQSTKEPGWKHALGSDCELIAIHGGDGTVAKVLRRLDADQPPVAILPGGSANNIAASLRIDSDPAEWIAQWPDARLSRFWRPQLRAGERFARFIEAAGLGVFSAVIASAAEDEPRGDAKVALGVRAFVDHLRSAPVRRWTFEVDGALLREDAVMLEVLNVPRIGPRIDLSPGMEPGAGTVDVVWVPPDGCRLLVEALLDGATVPDDALQRHRGRLVRLDADSQALHVDDEVWDARSTDSHVEIRSDDSSVSLLRPG